MPGRKKDTMVSSTTKQINELAEETINNLKAKLDSIISTATYIRDLIQNNFEPPENETASDDIDITDTGIVQEQERQKRTLTFLQDWSSSSTSQLNENDIDRGKGSPKNKKQNFATSCPKYLKKTLNTRLKTNSKIAKAGNNSAATSLRNGNSVFGSTLKESPKNKKQNVATCPKYLKKTLNTCLKTNSEIAKVGNNSAATSLSNGDSVVESTSSELPHLEYTSSDENSNNILEASKCTEINKSKRLSLQLFNKGRLVSHLDSNASTRDNSDSCLKIPLQENPGASNYQKKTRENKNKQESTKQLEEKRLYTTDSATNPDDVVNSQQEQKKPTRQAKSAESKSRPNVEENAASASGRSTRKSILERSARDSTPVPRRASTKQNTRKSLSNGNITDIDTNLRRSSRVSKPVERKPEFFIITDKKTIINSVMKTTTFPKEMSPTSQGSSSTEVVRKTPTKRSSNEGQILEENGNATESSSSDTSSSPSLMDIHKRSRIVLNKFLEEQMVNMANSTPQPKNKTKKNANKGSLEGTINSTPIPNTINTKNPKKSLSDERISQRRSPRVSKPVNRASGASVEENGDITEQSTRINIHKRSEIMWDNFVQQFNDHVSSTPNPKNAIIGKKTKANSRDENVTNGMPIPNNTTTRKITKKSLSNVNITDVDTNRRRSSRVSKPFDRISEVVVLHTNNAVTSTASTPKEKATNTKRSSLTEAVNKSPRKKRSKSCDFNNDSIDSSAETSSQLIIKKRKLYDAEEWLENINSTCR